MFQAASPASASRANGLVAWARRTTSSFFNEALVSGFGEEAIEAPSGELIYRLTAWPELPQHEKTAGVLRTLSVMTSRPVNRRWIELTSRLKSRQVDRLLAMLDEQGALRVIDPASFA